MDSILKEQFKGKVYENQWFGVTISSTVNGSFSACAHKYVHHYDFTNRDEHAAYGACYRFSNDFNQEYKVNKHNLTIFKVVILKPFFNINFR